MSPVIDRLCDEFEAAWRQGRPVTIESMIQRASTAERASLLGELIRVEIELRRETGDVPDKSAYLERFPNEATAVRLAWSTDEMSAETIGFAPESVEPPRPPTTASLEVTRDLGHDQPTQAGGNGGSHPESGHANSAAGRPGSGAISGEAASRAKTEEPCGFPKSIGRYPVVARLGRGGQADVFRGIHPTLPIEVAIKQTRQAVSQKACEALKQEADILCDLDHPHIARVRDFDIADGRPFMVLDFIRGRSLAGVAASHPLSPEDTAKLVAKLARAMAYAHARGVLHRDLKPENVVIDESGEPKIIDFGMSRLRSGMVAAAQEADEVSGTLAYMPPEQARGVAAETDHRVDLFALGAILYRLLVGQAPYANLTPEECLPRVRRGQWDREALQSSGVPEPLQAICFRAMDPDPSKRFADAAEFAEKLEHTWDEMTGQKSVPLIRAFELIHIGNSTDRAEFSGPLYQFRPPRTNDDIQVRAEFNAPAYCFLVALNPDGGKQLCCPPEGNVPQRQPITTLRYPADDNTAFGLTDGVGQQAFVLVASREPLPAFDIWASELVATNWPHPDVVGSWRYAMGELQTMVSQPPPNRGTIRATLTPTRFKELCDRLRQRESHDVQGIIFNVQS